MLIHVTDKQSNWVEVNFFFLTRGCLIVPAVFVEKTIFSAMIYLDTTVSICESISGLF